MAATYMTKEGYDKILAEINYLETVKRPEISAAIAEARDKGDLSENAEDDGTLTGVVRQCVCPGVRDDTQVFCPASVLLEEAQDESSPE